MRWAGLVARMGDGRVEYTVLMGRPEVRRRLGRSRYRWDNNIKMDFQEAEQGDMDWIAVTWDRDIWWVLVNVVMHLWVLP
jgi:hypothetical protein